MKKIKLKIGHTRTKRSDSPNCQTVEVWLCLWLGREGLYVSGGDRGVASCQLTDKVNTRNSKYNLCTFTEFEI